MGFQNFLCIIVICLTQSSGDSSEEHPQFGFNRAYAPLSAVFHDIYSPHHIVPEDSSPASTEENFQPNTVSTQFVEFHPEVLKIQPMQPPSKLVLNSSYVKIKDNSSVSSTTHEPDETPIRIPAQQYERGVLDLLLPPSRVRSFKNVFDTFRRMLSHTFRKR